MTQRIGNPFTYFSDGRGRPLTGGKVYIGQAGQDPELHPISTFWDVGLSVGVTQPINVIGGALSNNGNPALVFVSEDNYSIRVRDADGAEVLYVASAVLAVDQFQPLDSDLTAIANTGTSLYGIGLLRMLDGAALRAYAGIVDPLPIVGGQVTGAVKRSGAGAYVYMANNAYADARIYVTAHGASDPRTQIGDIWLEADA